MKEASKGSNGIKVIVKHPFKKYEVVEVPKGDLAHLRKIIDCTYLDFIHLGDGFVMAIDDCGKLDRKPANLKPRKPGVNDIFFGTVILMKDEFDSLSDKEIDTLLLTMPIHFHSVTEEENEKIDPDNYMETHMLFWSEE